MLGSSSKGFSYDELPWLALTEKSRYSMDPMEKMNLGGAIRMTDAERWELTDYLGDMYSLGALTKQEYEARRDFTLAAVTRMEIQALVRDLPQSMESWKARRAAALQQAKEQQKAPAAPVIPHWLVTSGVLLAFLSLMAMVTPFSAVNGFPAWIVDCIAVLMICAGLLKTFPKKKT